jgi:hypothetical protein
MLSPVSPGHGFVAPLLRAGLVVALIASVLLAAYVVVTDRNTSPDVVARGRKSPVKAHVGDAVALGRGHAVMASGPSGLWVARQATTGAHGRIVQIDTDSGKPMTSYPINIEPQGIAVGRGVLWVLGVKQSGGSAMLMRIDPRNGTVERRLQLAEPPACATHPFASCYPVAMRDGVWVPLLDRIVYVPPSGSMADDTVQLDGHVWDLTSHGKTLWALAETALYKIDTRPKRPVSQRIALRDHLGPGVQSTHLVADGRSVWLSSVALNHIGDSSRLTRIDPSRQAATVASSQLYPGAGSLALIRNGLWVDRFDGQGELDRLNALDGSLTGPFVVLPDDPVVLTPRNGDLWVLSYASTGNQRTVTKVSLSPARGQ